ncbi:MAG: OmpA family protein [Alphaproteobacteria bacterium]|nr:OmpA family protein [Alphaproteobacteria bacterium]
MKLRTALLASAMGIALPAVAMAQPVSGPYIGATAGYNIHIDSDAATTGFGRNTIEFEGGGAGTLSLGWGFGNGFRVELEGGYRSNKVDGVTGAGGGSPGGTVSAWTAMANALFDFNLGPVNPYIGAGAGYAMVNYDSVGRVGNARIDGDDGQFAYQGIVGVSVPLTALARGLSASVEYRYVASQDLTIRNSAGQNVDLEWKNHVIGVGLRYAFGTSILPPALAPAVAAPAPARTYLVFFDFARANLTDRARGTIREAATASRSQQVTRLEVSGHADRVGSDATNMALSRRRADTVAAELVRNGVQRNQIVVNAFGESRPLVPTADNVREAQNRRVEIVLR